MGINPLQTIDQALGEEVLDLYEPVQKMIDRADQPFDYYELVPDYGDAREKIEQIEQELMERKGVKFEGELQEVSYQRYRREEGVARLYMAFGFVLGLRLSGASEEKVKELMKTYSFGLAEPEEKRHD